MSTNAPIDPIYYSSEYRHGVDDKRRIQIPAKWRPHDLSSEFLYTLIVWPKGAQQEPCLLVLPPDEWLALVQKLKSMPFGDAKAESLRRLIGRKSDRVPLDKGGRICIPDEMAKAAGIEKEAILIGLVDRFEIWSPKRYEAASALDEALASEAYNLI